MVKVKVMTDSSVQLTSEEVDKYQITVVPLNISIDGHNYVDGVDITRRDFVEKMNQAKELPKTSQPAIGKFVEVINKLTADGSQVVGIFLAKSLSGTIDAARQAVSIAGKEDQVTILDSELTDRAESFQVLAAAKDAQKGKTVSEIVDHVTRIRNHQHLRMMVVNLDNLIKGGRLGALSGKVATLLNIRIALHMHQGKLGILKKGRGKKFSLKFNEQVLSEIAAQKGKIHEIGISYVDTPKFAHELAKKIKEIDQSIDILVAETSPIIATHAGNGAYAILYYTE